MSDEVGEVGKERSENPTHVPRRLMTLLSSVVALDMAMYSVVTPMLPTLRRQEQMSDLVAGLLVGAYPLGLMLFSLPAGSIVSRFGVKATLMVGALTLGATSIAFGLAGTASTMIGARALQGFSSALSWTAALTWLVGRTPRDRQGVAIGTTMAAAGAGAMAGPALGTLALFWPRWVTFALVGFVAVCVAVGLIREARMPATHHEPILPTARGIVRGTGGVLLGVVVFSAAGLGALAVFIPLRLDRLGAASGVVGGVLLAVAVVELCVAPLIGRLVDQRGARGPIVCTLLVVTSVLLMHVGDSVVVTSAVVLISLPAVGLLYTPSLAGLTTLTQQRGLAMAGLFGLSNLAFATGEAAGALAAGWFEEVDAAYMGLCTLAAVAVLTALLVLCTLGPHSWDSARESA